MLSKHSPNITRKYYNVEYGQDWYEEVLCTHVIAVPRTWQNILKSSSSLASVMVGCIVETFMLSLYEALIFLNFVPRVRLLQCCILRTSSSSSLASVGQSRVCRGKFVLSWCEDKLCTQCCTRQNVLKPHAHAAAVHIRSQSLQEVVSG